MEDREKMKRKIDALESSENYLKNEVENLTNEIGNLQDFKGHSARGKNFKQNFKDILKNVCGVQDIIKQEELTNVVRLLASGEKIVNFKELEFFSTQSLAKSGGDLI